MSAPKKYLTYLIVVFAVEMINIGCSDQMAEIEANIQVFEDHSRGAEKMIDEKLSKSESDSIYRFNGIEYYTNIDKNGRLEIIIANEGSEEYREFELSDDASVMGSAYIDMMDENRGCVLYCSDPGAGLMDVVLYITDDGWRSLSSQEDLTDRLSGYPTGIIKVDDIYYITVLYHGENVYLYRRSRNGEFEPFFVEIPGENYIYVDGEEIYRTDDIFEMKLKVVRSDDAEHVAYVSKDGNKWESVRSSQ